MSELKHVTVYTDGSCIRNPGPGGYAAVLLHGEHRREITGGYRLTTNNRMELMAVIVALRALKSRCAVTVHSDATYVVDGVMKGTMQLWRSRGWRQGERLVVPNADLWEELLGLCQRHEVRLCWLSGHSGHAENERCDRLSVRAAVSANLPADEGYEKREERELALAAPQPTLFDGM